MAMLLLVMMKSADGNDEGDDAFDDIDNDIDDDDNDDDGNVVVVDDDDDDDDDDVDLIVVLNYLSNFTACLCVCVCVCASASAGIHSPGKDFWTGPKKTEAMSTHLWNVSRTRSVDRFSWILWPHMSHVHSASGWWHYLDSTTSYWVCTSPGESLK